MDHWYVYNKVHLLLAVFEAFEVLNDEDEKPGRAKTRPWILRKDEKGYFNNIVKEWVIKNMATELCPQAHYFHFQVLFSMLN